LTDEKLRVTEVSYVVKEDFGKPMHAFPTDEKMWISFSVWTDAPCKFAGKRKLALANHASGHTFIPVIHAYARLTMEYIVFYPNN
jgi:hypothetical protein